MQTAIFLVLLLALPLLQGELIQVIQLARHGARTPNSFEFIPNQFSETSGQLTVLGLVQQYFLGQEMRQRYVEKLKFLQESFNASEVVVKSSWKNRTVRSAYAFASGLYPQEEGVWYENIYAERFPTEQLLPLKKREKNVDREDIRRVKINEGWAKEAVKVLPMDNDLHFHPTKSENCPSADKIINELKKSHEFQEMEKYLSLSLYSQLASAVNGPLGFNLLDAKTLNIKKVKSVLDNYRCNSFHGNKHPNVVDETILKLLKKTRHYYAYKLTLKDDLVRSVAASKLLEEFLDYTQGARNRVPSTPKYVFYSAHDTTLEILLSVFLSEAHIDSGEHYNIIPFSSVFSIEIHKEQQADGEASSSGSETSDSYYMQLFFNDEPQFIRMCNDYKCSLDQFHRILEHHIVPSVEEFCSVGRVVADIFTNSTSCTDGNICEDLQI